MRAAILLRMFAGLMFGAASLQAGAADLLSVYREAQKEDAVFAAARANLSAGQEKLPQGLSGLLPALTVSGNVTRVNAQRHPGSALASGPDSGATALTSTSMTTIMPLSRCHQVAV